MATAPPKSHHHHHHHNHPSRKKNLIHLRHLQQQQQQLYFCFHLILLLLVIQLELATSSSSGSSNIVEYLPGLELPDGSPENLPFHLETGYVGIGESNDVEMFYYFMKSERSPKEDPLVLWLTGGPRCSVFSAIAFEIGPLYFDTGIEYNGSLPTLVLNPNSWTKIANILFVDAPVDTGFSYSKSFKPGSKKIGDNESALSIYEFLRKWLIEHPEFQSNPLYISGDSYSGLIIPIIVQELINDIEAGKYSFLNFKSMKESCKGNYVGFDLSNVNCSKDREVYEKCISGINLSQILEPLCTFVGSSKAKEMIGYRRSLAKTREAFIGETLPPSGCRGTGYLLSQYWANDDRVRKALHIKKGTVKNWVRCNYDLPYEFEVESSIEYHRNLSNKGYRSLIYSGDHDMWVSHISTEAWIRSLNLSIADDWRSWSVDGQIAGYTRTFSNGMTYATVKGGGHTAPEYRPKECFAMFERWISRKPL